MCLRERMLKREMARLLREVERQEKAQERRSSFSWGPQLFAALQHWQLWAVAAALLLLCGLCWRLRKRSCWSAISRKEGSSGNSAGKEKQEEFTMVEELMDELLRMCRELSRRSFLPELGPAVIRESTSEGWSHCEPDHIYQVLVPIRPPRGHTFHLELCSEEEMPVGTYRLRVELECICTQHMLCFLHHPEEELRKKQAPRLLDTLCTGPYLDTDKTYFWLHTLINAAWVLMPKPGRCHLTVLPSSHLCKLLLTFSSNSHVEIAITFGVQRGDSDTFTSIKQAEV
ncbi:inositol 1,4,5-trisphosphate receptor-interacting protein-like 1 [Apus apus]|uniref:inositol 1,4,5-trisphosphate receptor-interacting protein-like 1 n=1 Tax=Apus apus TaxID=8895 RepID=UPI0021F8CFFE|nr:inositol 1,4,5-trisphosphate receptor-interacting protein-like 1 [Apus apus]